MVARRLGEYIEKKDISYYAFENALGVSRGSISKAVKENKSIGSAVLENILTMYSDLNPVWLLTGKGSMLKPSGLMEDAEITAQDADVRHGKVVETIVYKSDPKDAKIIALQEDKIKMLEEKLHDRSVGLRAAPAADTPSVGGSQTSPK